MKKYLILLTLASLALFTCAGLEKLVQTPTLRIDDVNIASLDFEQIGLDFVFKVNNPNAFGVSVSAFDYLFAIDGKQLLAGQENRQLTLAAQQENLVHFPLTLKFADIYQLVSETKNKDTLSYRFSGSIIPAGLLAGIKIPFSKSGHVPNLRLPQLSLKNLKVNKLNLSGADLKLNISLKNPNSFAFNIGKFNYKLNLAGKELATGLTPKLADIPAKGNGEIELPVSINLAGALGSIYSALSGQSIQAALSGNAELATPFGPVALPINTQTSLKITR